MSGRPPVHITLENEDWFEHAEREWHDLIGRSQANPLFMGWIWQRTWWQCFRSTFNARLALLTARDATGTLRGIAPMMKLETRARRAFLTVQLVPIGNVWRLNSGEVTEHIDWIIDEKYEEDVSAQLRDYIERSDDWHEILLSYTTPESVAATALEGLARRLNCYVRYERALPYYSVDTHVPFEQFLHSLGGNTRKRLFGRRALLNETGRVRRISADSENIDAQLNKLDLLSQKRWGTGFSVESREFFDKLSSRLLREGTLRFSTLEVDGRPISALYDIDADGVTYNVRSAIDTAFHPKLSPGLLHLAFEIERACGREDIARYALLAGGGKSSDYKRDITTLTENFTSLQLVRRWHEKTLFRLYDLARNPERH